MKKRKKIKLLIVAGTRPNFIKTAPIVRAIKSNQKLHPILVHTGQHYDEEMSSVFLKELKIVLPCIHLGINKGSHASQTAQIMKKFEKIAISSKPDMVVVFGDVNSTLACALVASKLQIPLAHVEAGLRSYDKKMPEEINRILTDHVSDLLFTPIEKANFNLKKENIPINKIKYVGDVMADNFIYQFKKYKKNRNKIRYNSKKYAVMTLHRAENVDSREILSKIIKAANLIADKIPVYFPIHPRTSKKILEFKLKLNENIKAIKPLGYIEFLNLWSRASFVLTDSGGLQIETSIANIPCIIFRKSTERKILLTKGTSTLVGIDPKKLQDQVKKIMSGKYKKTQKLPFCDGRASERIVKEIVKYFNR